MPSCGISSGYALFDKVKKDPKTKIQYLVAEEKDRFQLLLTSPLLNKVNLGVRDRTNRKYSLLLKLHSL